MNLCETKLVALMILRLLNRGNASFYMNSIDVGLNKTIRPLASKYTECIEQFKKNLAVSVVDVAYLYSGYSYIELKNKEGAMQQYEALKKINERMAGALLKKIEAMPAD